MIFLIQKNHPSYTRNRNFLWVQDFWIWRPRVYDAEFGFDIGSDIGVLLELVFVALGCSLTKALSWRCCLRSRCYINNSLDL